MNANKIKLQFITLIGTLEQLVEKSIQTETFYFSKEIVIRGKDFFIKISQCQQFCPKV